MTDTAPPEPVTPQDDSIGARIDEAIQTLRTEVNGKIDAIQAQLGAVMGRVDAAQGQSQSQTPSA